MIIAIDKYCHKRQPRKTNRGVYGDAAGGNTTTIYIESFAQRVIKVDKMTSNHGAAVTFRLCSDSCVIGTRCARVKVHLPSPPIWYSLEGHFRLCVSPRLSALTVRIGRKASLSPAK